MSKHTEVSEIQGTKSLNPTSNGGALEGAAMTPPPELKIVKTDTDGFWDEDSPYPVYGRLMFSREVVPGTGPSKGKKRQYYVLSLLAPTMLKERKGANARPAKPAAVGDVIGVWATPGLSDLQMLANCTVWVKKNPASEFKDTGKGNPMKTYTVKASGERKKVILMPFTAPTSDSSDAPVTGASGVSDEEIPF